MNRGSGAAFVAVGIVFLLFGLIMPLLLKNPGFIAFTGTGVVFLTLGLAHMRRDKG